MDHAAVAALQAAGLTRGQARRTVSNLSPAMVKRLYGPGGTGGLVSPTGGTIVAPGTGGDVGSGPLGNIFTKSNKGCAAPELNNRRPTGVTMALTVAAGAVTADDAVAVGQFILAANSTYISSDKEIPNNFQCDEMFLYVNHSIQDAASIINSFYIKEAVNVGLRARWPLARFGLSRTAQQEQAGTAAGELAVDTQVQAVLGQTWPRYFDPDTKYEYTLHLAKAFTLAQPLEMTMILYGTEDG